MNYFKLKQSVQLPNFASQWRLSHWLLSNSLCQVIYLMSQSWLALSSFSVLCSLVVIGNQTTLYNRECHCLMAIYTMWFDNKFCVACGAWTFYGKVGNAHNHFECMHSHCGHKFTSCGQNTRINPILYTFNYDSEDVVTMMNVPHSSYYVVPSFLGIRPLIPHGYNHSNDFSLWLEIHGLFVGRLYEHM